MMASFMGKATSPTGGRDGTLHYGRLDLNIYNLPSHIPANFPVATGMAFAAKYRGEDKVCLAFCGDGSTSRADFHEALTLASVQKLPNIFFIENNQYAYSTPLRLTSASETFAAKAVAYGMPGVKVDGTDALAVHEATVEAVARARAGEGPSLIEGVTMRMHGHAEHDPADYVLPELYEEYSKKDPVELFENVLIEGGRDRRRHGQAGPGGRPAGGHRGPAQGAGRPDARPQQRRGRCLCRLTRVSADLPGSGRPGPRLRDGPGPGRLHHR